MNKRTAMLLAAGLGTRLKELTHDRPKALVEVAGRPLLQRNIDNLIRQGFDTIIVNVHHFGDQVIRYLDSHRFDAEVYVSDERGRLMDTGGGIVQALPFFHDAEAVLVHNVDILSDIPLRDLYDRCCRSDDHAWLLTQDRDTTRKLLFDEHELLVGWKNLKEHTYKWVQGERAHYDELAFNGIHILKPGIFAEFSYQRYSIIDLYLWLARRYRIRSVEIHPGFWFDIGKIEDFGRINETIATITENEKS
ncbi:MAG: nucleotidyltransferase family protein [Bacteroidales bacterium]|nr:nucleotidyltransferase family protein [Bacteroidales bacterium]